MPTYLHALTKGAFIASAPAGASADKRSLDYVAFLSDHLQEYADLYGINSAISTGFTLAGFWKLHIPEALAVNRFLDYQFESKPESVTQQALAEIYTIDAVTNASRGAFRFLMRNLEPLRKKSKPCFRKAVATVLLYSDQDSQEVPEAAEIACAEVRRLPFLASLELGQQSLVAAGAIQNEYTLEIAGFLGARLGTMKANNDLYLPVALSVLGALPAGTCTTARQQAEDAIAAHMMIELRDPKLMSSHRQEGPFFATRLIDLDADKKRLPYRQAAAALASNLPRQDPNLSIMVEKMLDRTEAETQAARVHTLQVNRSGLKANLRKEVLGWEIAQQLSLPRRFGPSSPGAPVH